jgi:hypothetical protein
MSGSISASRSEVDGEYVSVNQQSGIVAGDGGFDIKVHGNTDLAGGKIASTERAVQDEKNSLTTETLTQREIANHSRYEANSRSISIGGGYADANSAMNGTGIGSGNASGSDDSSTGNGVSGGAIVIIDEAAQWAKAGKTVEQTIASINTDVSSDKDNSGSLTKGWDGLQLQEEVNAQAQVTAAFGKEAGKGIGAYATDRENNLRREARAAYLAGDKDKAEQLNGEADNWSEGGAYRIALHTAAGALTGRVNGEAVSAAAMPEIAKSIEKMDLPNAVKQGLAQVAAAVVGAAAGGAAGVAGAVHVEANNRQLHPTETEMINKNAARFAKELYGTDNPNAEQIVGAMAILSNTAQNLLDNNLGYHVPYFKLAEAFLQTLQGEYASISPNLSIGDGQYLFYATSEQRSDPQINAGTVDKKIGDIITKIPVKKSAELPGAENGKRDPRTGLPLDDQGRYSERAFVDGKTYQPKYFPCGEPECQGHNLDTSDPGTQSYLKAIDKKILDDIGDAASLGAIATPVGAGGVTAGLIGSSSAIIAGILNDEGLYAAAKEAGQLGVQRYMEAVWKLPQPLAIRLVTAIRLAGGWDAFSSRVRQEHFGDKNE